MFEELVGITPKKYRDKYYKSIWVNRAAGGSEKLPPGCCSGLCVEYHRDLVYRIGRQCLDFCAGDPKDALRHGQCCAVQCCTVHTVVFLFDAISVFYAYPQRAPRKGQRDRHAAAAELRLFAGQGQ